MRIYPAIDIIGGECVRLIQGDYGKQQSYGVRPVQAAADFMKAGAQLVHIVDLDGAKAGSPQNLNTIKEIVEQGVPIQLGGGIRTMETIDTLLGLGVNRVILGTAALENRSLVEQALKVYGSRIVIGIDARDGAVAVEGWTKTSAIDAVVFAQIMADLGARTIVYTDIARDGMLQGPNLEAMEEMAKATTANIIASGGVSSLEDIRSLSTTGVEGVIIGKAFHNGLMSLQEAIEAGGGVVHAG